MDFQPSYHHPRSRTVRKIYVIRSHHFLEVRILPNVNVVLEVPEYDLDEGVAIRHVGEIRTVQLLGRLPRLGRVVLLVKVSTRRICGIRGREPIPLCS